MTCRGLPNWRPAEDRAGPHRADGNLPRRRVGLGSGEAGRRGCWSRPLSAALGFVCAIGLSRRRPFERVLPGEPLRAEPLCQLSLLEPQEATPASEFTHAPLGRLPAPGIADLWQEAQPTTGNTSSSAKAVPLHAMRTVYVPVYIPNLPTYLCIYVSTYLSVYLSIESICLLPICLSTYLQISPPVYLYTIEE